MKTNPEGEIHFANVKFKNRKNQDIAGIRTSYRPLADVNSLMEPLSLHCILWAVCDSLTFDHHYNTAHRSI